MFAEFVDWLKIQPQGVATFIGTLAGSGFGFAALLAGALFNARLNRKRDDRLFLVERRGVAAALRAELASIETTLRENAKGLRAQDKPSNFVVPDIAHSVRVFPAFVSKIGLLGDSLLIAELVDAHIVIDQYCENLLMAGGEVGSNIPAHRRVIALPAARAEFVASMNDTIAQRMSNTMRLLDRFLD